MHFKTIFKSLKNKDMLKRVGIILGILVAYRLLSQIPVPMGDASTFKEAVSNLMQKSDFSSFASKVKESYKKDIGIDADVYEVDIVDGVNRL